MDAIIMAAGKGNRLRDVTGGAPKCYVEVAGETLLARNLRIFRAAGVKKFVIVNGHERRRLIADYSSSDVEWAFNPFYGQANVLASFWAGMDRLTGDFLYLHADTVFHPEIVNLLVASEGDFVLACDQKVCAEEEMKYRLEKGSLIEINKTMDPAKSRGEFLGLCKVRESALPALREAVERVLERGQFEAFFEVAIQDLVDRAEIPVTVCDVGDLPWTEIDFPEDYERARQLFG